MHEIASLATYKLLVVDHVLKNTNYTDLRFVSLSVYSSTSTDMYKTWNKNICCENHPTMLSWACLFIHTRVLHPQIQSSENLCSCKVHCTYNVQTDNEHWTDNVQSDKLVIFPAEKEIWRIVISSVTVCTFNLSSETFSCSSLLLQETKIQYLSANYMT